jgi:oligopeptide/dipeptide ABC transporter ATP-binding protein
LEVSDLRTYFFTRWGMVKAVDGVSFALYEGETLGIVGESGCGKSVTCLSILRMLPESVGQIVGGDIVFEGENLVHKTEREMCRIRGSRLSMILQDPMTSLNPVFSVGEQIAEAFRIHRRFKGNLLWAKVTEMLRLVKIPAPEVRLQAYPHQMSGGMRQRVVGAICMSCQPRLLIADEPTTSLDVTIQAQYLRLLKELQAELGLSLIFITHDFGVVAKMCDRVAVMYAGRIVESADVRKLFNHPAHPYTVALLDSVPHLEGPLEQLVSIEGQPPALYNLPEGCSFAPRCPHTRELCRRQYPPEVRMENDHRAFCWMLTDEWDG